MRKPRSTNEAQRTKKCCRNEKWNCSCERRGAGREIRQGMQKANKWGIPLEQYAAEKMKVTKSEGDYTTINMQRGGK